MKKILSTLVMCLILGVSSVWAEQVQVSLYDGTNRNHELITQTVGGKNYNSLETLGLTLVQLNKSEKSGTAWIQFKSLDFTIISSYQFQIGCNGATFFFKEYPKYAINDGNSQDAPNDQDYNTKITGSNISNTFKVSTTTANLLGSYYYCRLKNFQLNVVIPEVVDRTVTTTTTLTKLQNSDLDGGWITRSGFVPFVVKDPIDQTNPQNYFKATIKDGATGESWKVLESGWSCVDNNAANRATYNVENTTLNSKILLVPVQYTATNKQKGTFSATVHLESWNTYNTANDDQNVQITVGDVKQEYAISWGNSWVDGGEITLFKGATYPRSGTRGYLANTGELALGIPTTDPADSPIISFDNETGEMTLLDEGTVKLTYTQPATLEYNEKVLTLTVHIVKQTPEFTLHYDEKVGDTYVFYVNRDYKPFVTSSNTTADDIITINHNDGANNQFISFDATNATTYAVPMENIQITVAQEEGDYWYTRSATYTIAIREDPIHVRTLCDRSMYDLFYDNRFTIDRMHTAAYNTKEQAIQIGSTAGGSNGGYVIFHFTGTPDALEWTEGVNYETTSGNNVKWTVEQSATNNEGSYTSLGAGNTFNKDSRYLKITISGTQSQGLITRLCITERVGVEILPAEIELVKMGNEVKSAAFSAKVSNLTNVVLTINSSEFGLARMESDAPQTSITLDYKDGLGIDKLAIKQLVVKYKGVADDSAIGKTGIITANDAGGKQLAVANVKVTGMIMVDGVPQTILQSNATTTGIYTGTNKSSNDFPYHTKRQLNLSRCFDANTGMALFDMLYIFGITTNTDGGDDINAPNSVRGCNAKTPCYVYQKGDNGDRYEYQHTFDAASTRFDHGTTMSGMHLYFTGYCPFAYVGDQSTQNGWMYFQGNTGVSDRVDIYLDSCQIFARHKTPDGKYGTYNNYELVISVEQIGAGEDKINYSYLSGYSSPFVFTSGTKNSGTSFRPTIHIAGKNHVKGQLGSKIHNTIADITPVIDKIPGGVLIPDDKKQIHLGIGGVNTYSAPIAVKPTDVGQYTELTMTDIWKDNTITNGYIRLDAADIPGKVEEAALSIDLGSATGSLTINGGQYHMRNAAADGSYTCNLAVGYKTYGRSEQAFNTTLQAQLYGFGNDQADSKVTINSGTFTMYKNVYAGGLGTDYYKDQDNFLDLRLPAGKGDGKSRINGGTFNGISNVVTCKSTISTGADPMNAKFWLTLWDVPITGTNPDGSAQFSLDDIEFIQDAYPAEYPIVTYTLVNDIDNVKKAIQYGGQSANAYKKTIDGKEKDVVTLLLPGALFELEKKSEILLRNWVTAVPYLDASKKLGGIVDVTLTQGGPINVDVSSASENIKYENKQLIFADLEGLEGYSYTLQAQGAGMKIKDNENAFGQINNTDSYDITDNLNLLKVVQADTWYTFTAPFDVHEISVIEASNSSYKESTIETNKRVDAMRLQAEADLHFMYDIYTFIVPNDEGRASSLTFNQLLGRSQKKQVLNHYDGTNIMDANFYLYELASEVFGTDGTGEELDISWTPVATPAEGSPILKKGKVYAMQFPWCPMCNDLASRTYYDYWSNKMILFYGKGLQTIEGSSSQSTILSEGKTILSNAINSNAFNKNGAAILAGNSTFADMTLTAANTAYVHNMTTDYFEPNTAKYIVKPTEGFLLYTPKNGAQMPARISRSGKIEYDENVETGVGGVPTVGDRTSLMLFGAYDGFEILSLCEQLVTVYNLQGNVVFQQYMAEGEQVYVGTGAGIFVVRGESETIKVMVE